MTNIYNVFSVNKLHVWIIISCIIITYKKKGLNYIPFLEESVQTPNCQLPFTGVSKLHDVPIFVYFFAIQVRWIIDKLFKE